MDKIAKKPVFAVIVEHCRGGTGTFALFTKEEDAWKDAAAAVIDNFDELKWEEWAAIKKAFDVDDWRGMVSIFHQSQDNVVISVQKKNVYISASKPFWSDFTRADIPSGHLFLNVNI